MQKVSTFKRVIKRVWLSYEGTTKLLNTQKKNNLNEHAQKKLALFINVYDMPDIGISTLNDFLRL